MYTHARLCGVLLKNDSVVGSEVISELDNEDYVLIKKAAEYYQAVEDAYKNLSPSTLAKYLFELSQSFNTYYGRVNISKSEPAMKNLRISILKEVQNIMRKGANLIGIELIDRM